jgi:hypothetical protein
VTEKGHIGTHSVADRRVVEMDILADPERLANLDLPDFGV